MARSSPQKSLPPIKLKVVRKGHKITVVLNGLTRAQRNAAKTAVNQLGAWIDVELEEKTLICTIHSTGTHGKLNKLIVDRSARSAATRIPTTIRGVIAKDRSNG